jgi:hypothetical protein
LNDISKKLQTEVIELKANLHYANDRSHQLAESRMNTMHTQIMEAISKVGIDSIGGADPRANNINQEMLEAFMNQQEEMKIEMKIILEKGLAAQRGSIDDPDAQKRLSNLTAQKEKLSGKSMVYGKPTSNRDAGSVYQQTSSYFKPPLPRAGDFGPGDVIRDGYSSRYGTKLPVKNLDEEVSMELDLDTARYMIAS